MVVMWCQVCNALMGMRQPFDDWSADRTGLCPECARQRVSKQDPDARRLDEPPEEKPEK